MMRKKSLIIYDSVENLCSIDDHKSVKISLLSVQTCNNLTGVLLGAE